MNLDDLKILSNIIQKIPNIEVISMLEIYIFTTFALDISQSLNNLYSLDLSKTCLTIKTSFKLVILLKTTPNLSQLILRKVALYEDTLYPIIEYITNMKSLSLFDISYNMLSQNEVDLLDKLNIKIINKNIKIQNKLHKPTFKPTINIDYSEHHKKRNVFKGLYDDSKRRLAIRRIWAKERQFTFKPTINRRYYYRHYKKRNAFKDLYNDSFERLIKRENRIKWAKEWQTKKYSIKPYINGFNMNNSYANKLYRIEKYGIYKKNQKYNNKNNNNTDITDIVYIQNTIPKDGFVNTLISENYTDIKIKCYEEIYSVNSKILMYYNQRLKAIIEDRKRDEIIELPDLIDEVGFKGILKYYGFQPLEITTENVISLLLTCLCLDIEDVRVKCLEYIYIYIYYFIYYE